MTDDVSEALSAIKTYLTNKTVTPATVAQSVPSQPALKHYEMWAHFEKLMEKLGDEDIADLNFEFTKAIHDAVKQARNKN